MEVDLQTQPQAEPPWNKDLYCTAETFTAEPFKRCIYCRRLDRWQYWTRCDDNTACFQLPGGISLERQSQLPESWSFLF